MRLAFAAPRLLNSSAFLLVANPSKVARKDEPFAYRRGRRYARLQNRDGFGAASTATVRQGSAFAQALAYRGKARGAVIQVAM
ncbi:hypothetical protein J5226_04075 [Lysobacter sp. K5869]|uniref:hypothetical protein n=1 Tax=Lysobacter sp. K5869 TaxID=2820808 RepID=UPI001C062CA9|nr:hypothetical protein [Lysobacter sp. K5869]QWP77595.1 hypothetical protein J5226_04075 [Lysobacter sp. K5869]